MKSLQGCALRDIPQELARATRPRRLRIVDDLDYLTLDSDAINTLMALVCRAALCAAFPGS